MDGKDILGISMKNKSIIPPDDYKYVITSINGFEMPFVFHHELKHQEISQGIGNYIRDEKPHFVVTPVSAGLVEVTTDSISAYGKSGSLLLYSRPEDSEIIQRRRFLINEGRYFQ